MTWKPDYSPNEKMDKFMAAIWPYALTFDDVTIVPGRSSVKPNEVSVNTYFSRRVPLKRPFVSAAMDTVTESRLAAKLASLGGIGIIHRNMTKEEQAEEVERTKYALNRRIDRPITFKREQTMGDILNLKSEHDYSFNTFPIVNGDNKLIGLITGRQMLFRKDAPDCVLETIMETDVVYGTKGMNAREAYDFMKAKMVTKLPLVDDNGVLAGLYIFNDLVAVIEKEGSVNIDERGQLVVGAAIGSKDFERAELLVKKDVNVLVVDSAHAHTKDVIETVMELKKQWDRDVVVGNIATTEAAMDLIKAGADGLKVGIGPGSICTTRIVAGIGVPQITAIYDTAQGTKGEVPICADGGLRYSGDITKAIAAGADNVMMGSLFAGADESPGDSVIYKGRRWKKYRGMGSLGAMKEREESRDRYGQSEDSGKLTPEGVEGLRPYSGPLEDIVYTLEGGLRSGMGYAGAPTIQDLCRTATFRRITTAGLQESHPHDIVITEEAPNYPGRGS